MSRYAQLIDIVREMQPRTILEVGTWKGGRALEMHEASPHSRYIGFDLFEDATAETDRAEFNVKKHHAVREVQKKLASVGMDAELVKGNTRETLPRWIEANGGVEVDLAFIDGGHSVETIAEDFRNILSIVTIGGGTIIFDDYYTAMPNSRLDVVGCNQVVRKIPNAKILPVKGKVAGGGFVQMVRVDT